MNETLILYEFLTNKSMKRELRLALEPVEGAITMFYAFVDNIKVMAFDGSRRREWTGAIPQAQVRVKVRVVGIGASRYKLTIDLPGTANDQHLILQLEGGYHEIEILL